MLYWGLRGTLAILRGYKTELAPNNTQASLLGRCCGASRYVYNWGLAEWQRQYQAGEKPSAYGLCKQFNGIKDTICPWIRELPYAITEAAFANLGAAFRHFFRRVKAGDKPGYPRFKKRGRAGSFQLRDTKIALDRVRLTRPIGWVRLKERGYIPAAASRYGTYATVSERAGRWYISVLVEEEAPNEQHALAGIIGIDVGLLHLAVCSDGTVYENPRALKDAQLKLKRLQRELSRRQKGGANWRKTKARLAKQHMKVANIRKHALHQVTKEIIRDKAPEYVVIEDLNVRGMQANHHLAQAVSDASFYELRRQFEYKASWNGTTVLISDRWYPSSKTCSRCGCLQQGLRLSQRTFRCADCGLVMDRDLNAAKNLAALAKRETHADCLGS